MTDELDEMQAKSLARLSHGKEKASIDFIIDLPTSSDDESKPKKKVKLIRPKAGSRSSVSPRYDRAQAPSPEPGLGEPSHDLNPYAVPPDLDSDSESENGRAATNE